MGFTNFSSILGERKTIPNHLELPSDILKVIYYLVLEESHRMLLLCLGTVGFRLHTLSAWVCSMPNCVPSSLTMLK